MKLLAVLLVTLAVACAQGGAGSLPAVGAAAPEVTLQRLDGGSFTLSSLRGKTVLLNFWFHG